MKRFKNIIVFSNGSFHFCHNPEILTGNKSVVFKRQDDKNFSFNQKKVKYIIDSKYSLSYKKKYLK
jgi:hypothetical protein